MSASLDGVLIVDKPAGPTSHDVVQRLRRALGERRVGHAGTLDPAATGVLVVLVGEATKLEPYFSACDKAYVADVLLGRSTDTLDLEGATVAEAPIPAALHEELLALERDVGQAAALVTGAIQAELSRTEQTPPAYSAIKVAGRRSHAEARAGRPPELAARPVRAASVRLVRVQIVGARPVLTFELEVSKGYYVRSFARDVGRTLEVPAMLAGLRRTRSGPFGLEGAIAPESERSALADALLTIEAAAGRLLPCRTLTASGCVKAHQGKRLSWGEDAIGEPLEPGPRFALVHPDDGALVAIAAVEFAPQAHEPDGAAPPIGEIRVIRGFVPRG